LKRDHTVNVLKDSWEKCVQYAFSFIPIDFDDDVGDVVDDDTESTLFKFRELVIKLSESHINRENPLSTCQGRYCIRCFFSGGCTGMYNVDKRIFR